MDSWEDTFDIIGKVGGFILGARMYPGYEQYWQAVLDNPRSILPFTGRAATEGEIEYAEFAARTPHVVVRARCRACCGSTRESFAISRGSPIEGGARQGHACRRRGDVGREPHERGTRG